MRINVLSLLTALVLLPCVAFGQFRAEQPSAYDYTGAVMRQDVARSAIGDLASGFRFRMQHNYSMNFMTGFGGAANVNAYSNIMQFGYGEKFDGQVVLSLLHSPFGNTMGNHMMGFQQPQVLIQDAHFNYRLNENVTFSVGFSQMPMNNAWNQPWGMMNPWQRSFR